MAIASNTSLIDLLRQHRLLEAKQLAELTTFQDRLPDPKALAGELIRRGWLTPYQANQLLNGKGHELVLGSYILLERLGEGGMGQVFKARHRTLGRVAAIKLIRKERLDNANAVKRFQREVRSAAALSHPNIVLAYDADEIAGTHLMVMEYIEGAIDLAKLVKKNGPLPIERACEYIRQAALGLQHAYERGMVHRDIKPANLLLTDGGRTIKVLDMGLARLDRPTEDDDNSSGTMTQEGAVMGTPDYIAPEQALDTHSVDIRADLYSLGGSLYYLLTGRVPFPGGTLMQKLYKHQSEEPLAVEKLRPEVPPEVVKVVRKLMAKKPADRFQTPAEAAAALAAAGQRGGFAAPLSAGESTLVEGDLAESVMDVGRDSHVSAFAYMGKRDDTVAFEPPPARPTKPIDPRWFLVAGVSGVVAVLGLAVVVLLAVTRAPEKKPPAKGENPAVVIAPPKKLPPKVDDAWLKLVAAMPAAKQVEAVAAKLIEFNPGFDGAVTPNFDGDVVTELKFLPDNVTDLSPVRALTGLRTLDCRGSFQNRGALADLTPLRGMKLHKLLVHCTAVADLAPLEGMPLTVLSCHSTKVSDLSPLRGMRLTFLDTGTTAVRSLEPVRGMPLDFLHCDSTQIADLAPLADMPLHELHCHNTPVEDLAPLKGMPLENLRCNFSPYRDAEILRSLKTLAKINQKTATQFWNEVDAEQAAFDAWCKQVAALPAKEQVEAVKAELIKRNPGFDGKLAPIIGNGGVVMGLTFMTGNVTDIAPVRALTGLRTLTIWGTGGASYADKKGKLADLAPLKDMKLSHLNCSGTLVSDLAPLKNMKLMSLWCCYTKVADLAPLKDMKLADLNLDSTRVANLAPLKEMTSLGRLDCRTTLVSDLSPLRDMKLYHLDCGRTQVSDSAPLRDMRLVNLWCDGTKVTDLSPLKGMPLRKLLCDFKAVRDAEALRPIKTLVTVNGKPAKQFWKEVDAQLASIDTWFAPVAANPAAKPIHRDIPRHQELLAIAKKGDVEVVFLGDSITQGWATNPGWKKHFEPLKAVNFGIGGDQTGHVLWRITEGSELDSIKPKVAVVMIGTNNTAAHSAPQIAGAIKLIVETIHQKTPATKVLLLGVFPRGEKPGTPIRQKIADLNTALAKLDDGGKKVQFLDIGAKFLDQDGNLIKELMPDFLHLSPKGYDIWAETITPTLTEWIRAWQPAPGQGLP